MNKYQRNKSKVIKSYRNVLRMSNQNATYKDAKRLIRRLNKTGKALDRGFKIFVRRVEGTVRALRKAVESLDLPEL